MFITDSFGVNEKGNLTISGVDTVELIQEYASPLYVFDENYIRETCKAYRKSMEECYGEGLVCYASKAFSCKEIYRIVESEGLGIDVVSGGELFTAMSVDFPAKKICFHGNNKTDDELMLAIGYGVGRIIVDNIEELNRVNELAHEAGKKVGIMLRIKPGIDAHTHSFVKTGQIDSKFGFALETGEALMAVEKAIKCENLNLLGLHCHIGSQIFDTAPFVEAGEVMLGFIAEIKQKLGYEISDLNLGGGFGIKYTEKDNPIPYSEYMKKVSTAVKAKCSELGVKQPFILIEPGRSIIGEAGITLYEVGSVKEIPNIRTYVAINGGMTDNPRYALYKSEYEMCIANKAGEVKDTIVTVAGKCCESGDLLGENVPLQKCERGDILCVFSTGAYNYSMASNYNKVGRPMAIMVKDGQSRVIIKRETYEDMMKNDI